MANQLTSEQLLEIAQSHATRSGMTWTSLSADVQSQILAEMATILDDAVVLAGPKEIPFQPNASPAQLWRARSQRAPKPPPATLPVGATTSSKPFTASVGVAPKK